jgi:hypothetical protein
MACKVGSDIEVDCWISCPSRDKKEEKTEMSYAQRMKLRDSS